MVREATIEDAAAIAQVHVRSWRWAYRRVFPDAVLDALDPTTREARHRARIADGKASTWVAEENGRVVAFAVCGRSRHDAFEGEIYALYAEEQSVGRGHGRRLIEACFGHLHEAGMSSAGVAVLEDNQRARGFYERMGGVAVGTEPWSLEGVEYVEVLYAFGSI